MLDKATGNHTDFLGLSDKVYEIETLYQYGFRTYKYKLCNC